MKKFIIITSIILTILFILLYIIIFYDYKTSEKTKKFMVSEYNDKNKTINTFCSDYYEFAKAYNKDKDKYYESMNLRRTGGNIWTGNDIIKYDELETTEEVSMGIISDYTPNKGYFRGKYLDKKSFKEFFKDSDWNLEGDLKINVYYQSKWTLYYQMEIKTENEKLHLWESCRYIK